MVLHLECFVDLAPHRVMALSAVSRAAAWANEHPIEAAVLGVGSVAAGAAAYLWFTQSEAGVFRKPPTVSFLETTGGHVDVS